MTKIVASVELLNVDLAPVRIGEERRRKERKKTGSGIVLSAGVGEERV